MARQNFTGLPDTDHTIIRNDLTETTRDFRILERNRGVTDNGPIQNENGPTLGRQSSLENHIADSFALGGNPADSIQENSDIFSGDVFVRNTDEVNENPDAPIVENDTLETTPIERCEIKRQPTSWYKFLCTPSEFLFFQEIALSG